VAWSEFGGFERLAAREELERMVRRAGLPTVPLAGVLVEPLSAPLRTEGGALIDERTPNTVYLPTFIAAIARSDADTGELKQSGYFVLRLDPERALAEYVAAMLNSELGRALRRELSGGSTMPSIRLSALRDAVVPLPSVDVQVQMVRTRERLRDLRVSLDDLERRLLTNPMEGARIEQRLRHIGDTDPLRPWMEVLPFPLASILERYQADAEPAQKVEHLLRFFEASAEFFATVLVSVFLSDDVLLAAEQPRWRDPDGRIPLERASFGNWTKLGAAMAGSARRLLSARDDGSAERMMTSFAVGSGAFRELASSKELWKALDRVSVERNEDAHGGIKSPSERGQKLSRLREELTGFRALTADAMYEVQLVRPGEGAFRKGVNQYRKAEHLSGHSDTFKQGLLESVVQLEADELYLIDVTDEPLRGALKLAPFVRLHSAPASEELACYFYSRLGKDGAEYVSHHFQKSARINVDASDVTGVLMRLSSA
jgi:hypothetical protein